MKKLIWILWPSFVIGLVAEVLFFVVVDPMELQFLGRPAGMSRLAVYSIGFLMFWAFAAASSGFTCYLQRSADEINRCPLAPRARPLGCPKREDPDAAR